MRLVVIEQRKSVACAGGGGVAVALTSAYSGSSDLNPPRDVVEQHAAGLGSDVEEVPGVIERRGVAVDQDFGEAEFGVVEYVDVRLELETSAEVLLSFRVAAFSGEGIAEGVVSAARFLAVVGVLVDDTLKHSASGANAVSVVGVGEHQSFDPQVPDAA